MVAYMNDDQNVTLGKKLRELREASGLSLRDLARAVGISAPFLSDVELGRRYPTDITLKNIADNLRVSVDTFKKYDHRTAIVDLKRFAEETPSLGAALRNLVEQVNSGSLPVDELANKLRGLIPVSLENLKKRDTNDKTSQNDID